MRRASRFTVVAIAALSVAAGSIAIAGTAGAATSGVTVERACAAPARGHAACFALRVTGGPELSAYSGPPGLHPADLAGAYKLDVKKGKGQTIAIVDAFDNPRAEADLAIYRSTYGLPACTTKNKCFKKVNQSGTAAPLPAADKDWGVEIALDIDMASATCPNCKILLVEARSDSFDNLGLAVDRAATMGATEISNSYGGPESEASLASHYDHPGIAITASSGDHGYSGGPQSPADFATVTAVAGTTLTRSGTARGWTETAWSGSGSGCSTIVAKPAWQHDTSCPMRMIADVAAVADPNTGVSIYDTYGYKGFFVVGGTSASAPIVAGVYALAGNAAHVDDASLAYARPAGLNDVTAGKNGYCSTRYVCTAKAGYDGSTGLGTPKGTTSF